MSEQTPDRPASPAAPLRTNAPCQARLLSVSAVAGQAAGFTVGTAALDGAFEVTGVVPHGLAGQLCAIQTVLQGAVAQA